MGVFNKRISSSNRCICINDSLKWLFVSRLMAQISWITKLYFSSHNFAPLRMDFTDWCLEMIPKTCPNKNVTIRSMKLCTWSYNVSENFIPFGLVCGFGVCVCGGVSNSKHSIPRVRPVISRVEKHDYSVWMKFQGHLWILRLMTVVSSQKSHIWSVYQDGKH